MSNEGHRLPGLLNSQFRVLFPPGTPTVLWPILGPPPCTQGHSRLSCFPQIP